MIKTLKASDLQSVLEKTRPNTHIIDVREQDEWDQGHISGAHLFPLSSFIDGTSHPDWNKDHTLIIYCKSGQRSLYAAELLQQMGYQDLYNIVDGYTGWKRSN